MPCSDSTEIVFSKLRSAGLNYNLPSLLTLTVRGVSKKHCLLTFFIDSYLTILQDRIKYILGQKKVYWYS